VATTEDLFDDPHLNSGGRLLEVELEGGRRTRVPRLPIEIGTHDLGLRRQPPQTGAHTREVLAELGLTEAELDALEARGIIECSRPAGAG
jgi:crotonobetainyl-CoA:carnitine CoA-transferase CaiB-like acyl-CoA transferase